MGYPRSSVRPAVRPAVRAAVADRDGPFSVLDLDAALSNAADMVRRAAGTPVRLASKSVRIRPLIERLLAVDGISGVLSYHLGEALWLVDEGTCDDILVAYPCADRRLLARWASRDDYRRAVTVMVDDVAHLDLIDEVLGDDHPELRVCLDVDASLVIGPLHLGARRSPVHTPGQAAALAREIAGRPGVRLVGLMAYEGQIAGTTDSSPAVTAMKRISARELAGRRGRVVAEVGQALADAGAPPLEFVNGGGTGSIETTAAEPAVTEIGAGSGVIGSGLFDRYRAFRPQPAEWFVLPVVRRPAPDTVTVAGGGRIASGVPGADRVPVVDYPAGLSFSATEGAGEVQTPLRGDAAASLRLGDHVWFRHAKAGEQAEWTDEVLVVERVGTATEITAVWPTYRGEQQSFV
jgi:D-serine deaminase-like pyridoxal phosphate-dependent protein